METIFWLIHNGSPRYRYASEDTTLIGYSSTICSQCGRKITVPQYTNNFPVFVLEGGKTYPDYLQFCGAGRQPFILSERALDAFEKNGISGYSGYQLITYKSEILCNDTAQIPNYYILNITGRIDLDFAAMYLKKKRVCPKCGQYESNRMRLEPKFLDPTTWDGSDLCFLNTFPGHKLGTQKVTDIIKKYKLKGFSPKMGLIKDGNQSD